MTLLVNEIYVPGDIRKGFILFTADQRITKDGEYDSSRKKIFKIQYINAGIGYFGLAQLNSKDFFSDWIQHFINNNNDSINMKQFVDRLCDDLNRKVNKSLLKKYPSGFHVCGYNKDNYPEFWIVRNIGNSEGGIYTDLRNEYTSAEEFLARDAKAVGFDGINPIISREIFQYYVNGDIISFHTAWLRLTDFISEMRQKSNFSINNSPERIEEIAKWKMTVIASFYKKFAKKKIIGTPVDSFVILPKTI